MCFQHLYTLQVLSQNNCKLKDIYKTRLPTMHKLKPQRKSNIISHIIIEQNLRYYKRCSIRLLLRDDRPHPRYATRFDGHPFVFFRRYTKTRTLICFRFFVCHPPGITCLSLCSAFEDKPDFHHASIRYYVFCRCWGVITVILNYIQVNFCFINIVKIRQILHLKTKILFFIKTLLRLNA